MVLGRREALIVFRHRYMEETPSYICARWRSCTLDTVSPISSWRHGTESVVVMSSISIHSSPYNDTLGTYRMNGAGSGIHSLKDYDAGARRKYVGVLPPGGKCQLAT